MYNENLTKELHNKLQKSIISESDVSEFYKKCGFLPRFMYEHWSEYPETMSLHYLYDIICYYDNRWFGEVCHHDILGCYNDGFIETKNLLSHINKMFKDPKAELQVCDEGNVDRKDLFYIPSGVSDGRLDLLCLEKVNREVLGLFYNMTFSKNPEDCAKAKLSLENYVKAGFDIYPLVFCLQNRVNVLKDKYPDLYAENGKLNYEIDMLKTAEQVFEETECLSPYYPVIEASRNLENKRQALIAEEYSKKGIDYQERRKFEDGIADVEKLKSMGLEEEVATLEEKVRESNNLQNLGDALFIRRRIITVASEKKGYGSSLSFTGGFIANYENREEVDALFLGGEFVNKEYLARKGLNPSEEVTPEA